MNNSNKIIGGILLFTISTGITIELVDKHELQVHTHQEPYDVFHFNNQVTTISGSATIDQIVPTTLWTQNV